MLANGYHGKGKPCDVYSTLYHGKSAGLRSSRQCRTRGSHSMIGVISRFELASERREISAAAKIRELGMALCPSGVNKELRERKRALKAAMEEERNKEKAARYEEKQQESIKAVLEKNRHRQYRRDAALQALQVKTISAPSNPHIAG